MFYRAVSKIKSDIKKFSNKEYRSRLIYDLIITALIIVFGMIVYIYAYGMLVGKVPSGVFYIGTVVIPLMMLGIVFGKRAISIKGAAAAAIAVFVCCAASASVFDALNERGCGAKPVDTYSAKVLSRKERYFAKDEYTLIDMNGQYHTAYFSENFERDDEPRLEEYNGAFGIAVYKTASQ